MVSPFAVPGATNLGNLPLHFEPNMGQTDASVRFVAHSGAMSMYLTDENAVLALAGKATVKMKIAGSLKAMTPVGLEKLSGVSNYLIGNDPSKWQTNVPQYGRVKFKNVYPGVDVVYYGNGRQLEYDFLVAAGGNPDQIRLTFDGVESVKVDGNGDLVLRTAAGELKQRRPVVYQEIDGRRVEVNAKYLLSGAHVGFELARYDRKRPVVIDPVLVYSTYLANNGPDVYSQGPDGGSGIAMDSAGAVYVSGSTNGGTFPTVNALQPNHAGVSLYNDDLFITKINSSGSAIIYSTYLGGIKDEAAAAIAVDAAGAVFVTGFTTSSDFPTFKAMQGTLRGKSDAFVLKLNATGSALIYSTYLGGAIGLNGADDSEGAAAIAVDATGSAYVAGSTNAIDFPQQDGFQASLRGRVNGFVTKLDPTGTALMYSTYFGGSGTDSINGIAVDPAGSAYLVGTTSSENLPSQNAAQTVNRGQYDAFVAKLTPSGSGLVYSTYLGGAFDDIGWAIAVDLAGAAYITGSTNSPNFPVNNPFQAALKGTSDAFVAKLSADGGNLIYSTYLGGSDLLQNALRFEADSGRSIAVNATGEAYVAGATESSDFPLVFPGQTSIGPPDAFVSKFSASGNTLLFSTVLGGGGDRFGGAATSSMGVAGDEASGIAIDAQGNIAVTGITYVIDFPVYNNVLPSSHKVVLPRGNGNIARRYSSRFVTKFLEGSNNPFFTRVTVTGPAGVLFKVDGNAFTESSHSFLWIPGSTHTLDAGGPLPGSMYRTVFNSWSDGGAKVHTVTTPSSDVTYSVDVSFQYKPFIDQSSSGLPAAGSVSISPVSQDGYYNVGSTIQLTATANPGYVFSGWSVPATNANPITAVIDQTNYFLPKFAPTRTGALAAGNPVQVCDGSGLGVATFNWVTTGVTNVAIKVGSPSGPTFAIGGATGTAITGKWAYNGEVFYLQDVSGGLPFTAANTLATVAVNLTTAGCGVGGGGRTGTLAATVNPIQVCDGSGLAVAVMNWTSAGVSKVALNVGSPSGPTFTGGGSFGMGTTGKWAYDGEVFYLQDISNALPLTAANTLATLTVHLTTAGCPSAGGGKSGTLTMADNPVQVCDGSGLGVAVMNWSTTGGVAATEIHVGSPAGPSYTGGGASGTGITGKWTYDGEVFYLQDVSGGLPRTAENTLATLTVRLTSAGCSGPVGKSGTLTPASNPVKVCDGSGLGIAVMNWTASSGVTNTEINVGSPSGPMYVSGGATGIGTTGKWVYDGEVFYLQDVSGGLPRSAANTLATLTMNVTSAGCP